MFCAIAVSCSADGRIGGGLMLTCLTNGGWKGMLMGASFGESGSSTWGAAASSTETGAASARSPSRFSTASRRAMKSPWDLNNPASLLSPHEGHARVGVPSAVRR